MLSHGQHKGSRQARRRQPDTRFGAHAEESVLEAARRFVDTVNDIFPDIGDDAPRRKIIDSAFRMTEQLVGTSNEFARKLVKATSDATVKTEHETASRKSRR